MGIFRWRCIFLSVYHMVIIKICVIIIQILSLFVSAATSLIGFAPATTPVIVVVVKARSTTTCWQTRRRRDSVLIRNIYIYVVCSYKYILKYLIYNIIFYYGNIDIGIIYLWVAYILYSSYSRIKLVFENE